MPANPPADRQVLKAALDAFQGVTGLKAQATAQPGKKEAPHPVAVILVMDGRRKYRFAAEVKNADRVAALGQARNQIGGAEFPGLLVARHMTNELAEHCRRIGLNFMDTAGNAYLHADGLFVFVAGRRPHPLARRPTFRAFNPAGLRVIFALLCRPELLEAPYRAIQRPTGVALGTVTWLFNDLHDRGYLLTQGGKRRFVDARKLAAQWVENFLLKLRPRLNMRRFRAADPDWWKDLDLVEYGAVWGGEVGADRLTGNLRPERFTIYARGPIENLLLRKRLRADAQGEVEILDMFWDFATTNADPDVAPALLVYADLMATVDPRNHEAARLVYERLIGSTFDQA